MLHAISTQRPTSHLFNFGFTKRTSTTTHHRKILIQKSTLVNFQIQTLENIWDYLYSNAPLALRREPETSADPDQVAVYWQAQKLGYISFEENTAISQMLLRDQVLSAELTDFSMQRYNQPLLQCKIWLHV